VPDHKVTQVSYGCCFWSLSDSQLLAILTVVPGQEKTQVRLSRASRFCSWASENRSLVARWASEISLSGLVSLPERVSLINDNFQSET